MAVRFSTIHRRIFCRALYLPRSDNKTGADTIRSANSDNKMGADTIRSANFDNK